MDHGSNPQMQMSDEQHSIHHVNYVPEHELHHISNGDVMDDEHDEGNGVGESEAMEGDAPSDPGSLSDNRAIAEIGDQLTLSFQGQVYVFDSVSPEKFSIIYCPLTTDMNVKDYTNRSRVHKIQCEVLKGKWGTRSG